MKNIILKLSFLFIFLISTIMFSCKEEPPVRSDDGIRITNSTTFSNPYDSVGIVHNLIMDELINYFDDFNDVCDSANVNIALYDALSNATCEIGFYTPSSSCTNIVRTEITTILDGIGNISDIDDYIEESFNNQIAYQKYIDLMDLFDEEVTFNELQGNIVLLEIEIDTLSGINTNERTMLLQTCSVARHSLNYWNTVENNLNHAWRYNQNCTESFFKNNTKYDKQKNNSNKIKINKNNLKLLEIDPKLLAVAKADGKGFLVTALYTSLSGGFSLGSSVAAGAAYSIVEAVDQYWENISGWFGSWFD